MVFNTVPQGASFLANALAECRAARGDRVGPSKPRMVGQPEATIAEEEKWASEGLSESGQLEGQLVVRGEESPLVADKEVPQATDEDWEAILPSSEDDAESQHVSEGAASEECKVEEETHDTVGDEHPSEVLDHKSKRVDDKHPTFCIQEV